MKKQPQMHADQAGLVVRAVLSLGRRLRAERPPGSASLAATSLLATLRRLGPVPAMRLAAEERLQPQSITRLIAGLEDKGWLSRTVNERDRRETLIRLTPRGRQVLAADMRARGAWLERAMAAALTGSERDALREASTLMLKLALFDARSGTGQNQPDR